MKLGDKIKAVRLLAGEGQKELALIMGTKSPSHINRWEQGVAAPRAIMLQKLGEALCINWPWLMDSNMDFVINNFVYYRPLSPYSNYTARWLTLLPQELAELLPLFIEELRFEQFWRLDAPCNGGVIIVSKPSLHCMIVCRPELYPKLAASIKTCKQLTISDYEFAQQLFTANTTEELFERCGITSTNIPSYPKNPPSACLTLKLDAKLPADTNLRALEKRIQQHLDILIAQEGMQEVNCKITGSPAKSSNELAAELVIGANMKKLANLLLEKNIM